MEFVTDLDVLMHSRQYGNDKRTKRRIDEIYEEPQSTVRKEAEAEEELWRLDSEFSVSEPLGTDDLILLCEWALKISLATKTFYTNPKSISPVRPVLNRLKKKLFWLLFSDNKLLSQKNRFVLPVGERIYNFDTLIFSVILDCVSCLTIDHTKWGEYRKETPMSFPSLKEQNIFSVRLCRKPVLDFEILEIVDAMKTLEDVWFQIEFDENIPLYLDCILMRVSIIYRSPLNTKVLGRITNYYDEHPDGNQYCNESFLQDFYWPMTEMYKKLDICANLPKTKDVPEAHVERLQDVIIVNAKEMSSKNIELFKKTYYAHAMLESHWKKYEREYPNKVDESEDRTVYWPRVVKKIISPAYAKILFGILDLTPWNIIENKRFGEAELDLFRLVMMDLYISNLFDIKFADMFVVFNTQLMENKDLVLHDRHPLIVQDFNFFNLFNNGVIYQHNSFLSSFAHWYQLMHKAPFYGEYETIPLYSNTLNFLLDYSFPKNETTGV